MKLPGKQYLFLREAAATLQCSPQDLLHYGATGKLNIAVYLELWDHEVVGPPFSHENFFEGLDGLYYLDPKDIGSFERDADADVVYATFCRPVEDLYRMTDGWDLPEWIAKRWGDKFLILKDQLVVLSSDINAFLLNYCYDDEYPSDEELVSIQKTAKATAENPKSIDSLLKMVITMAIKGYTFNPADKKSAVTSEIVTDAESLGISLHPDTVRKWLREAASAHLNGGQRT